MDIRTRQLIDRFNKVMEGCPDTYEKLSKEMKMHRSTLSNCMSGKMRTTRPVLARIEQFIKKREELLGIRNGE